MPAAALLTVASMPAACIVQQHRRRVDREPVPGVGDGAAEPEQQRGQVGLGHAEGRRQREAVLAGAGPGGDASRPGHGVHRRERLVRRRALAELRQVEDRHRRRPVDHRPRHPRARGRSPAPGHRRWRRCAPPRPRAPGIGDAGQPQRRQPAVVVEPHHVAGIEREPRRRQRGRTRSRGRPTPRAAPGGSGARRRRRAWRWRSSPRSPGAPRRSRGAPRRSSRRTPRRRAPAATSAPAAARSPARGPARGPRRRRRRRRRDRRARASPPAARSRGWKRMTPSLSTASKPKCRASGAIEARGLSSAVIR